MLMLSKEFNKILSAALSAVYLDWLNNYLSIEKMAEDYGLTIEEVEFIIELGKKKRIIDK